MTQSVDRSILGQKFVRASGIFGTYLGRGAVYFGENVVTFLSLVGTVTSVTLAGTAFGLPIKSEELLTKVSNFFRVKAPDASVAQTPLQILAAAITASLIMATVETAKKLYKEYGEFAVGAYKAMVRDILLDKKLKITEDQFEAKKNKHPNNPKYNNIQDYLNAKRAQYDGCDQKTLELYLGGKYGKSLFKAGANALLDAGSTVAAMPWQFAAYVNSFGSSVVKSADTANSDADNTTKPNNGTPPGMTPN